MPSQLVGSSSSVTVFAAVLLPFAVEVAIPLVTALQRTALLGATAMTSTLAISSLTTALRVAGSLAVATIHARALSVTRPCEAAHPASTTLKIAIAECPHAGAALRSLTTTITEGAGLAAALHVAPLPLIRRCASRASAPPPIDERVLLFSIRTFSVKIPVRSARRFTAGTAVTGMSVLAACVRSIGLRVSAGIHTRLLPVVSSVPVPA